MSRAVRLDGGNSDARFDLPGDYLQEPSMADGGRNEAEAALPEIDAIDPAMGPLARGQMAIAEKVLAAALEHFEAALSADPRSLRAPTALAGLHLREQRNAEARTVWQQALEQSLTDPFPVY